jgi:hypothetical protein
MIVGMPDTAGGGPEVDPPGPDEIPTHSRRIEFQTYERGDALLVVGRLRDDRPWAAGGAQPEHVHDMTLEVTVRRPELVVVGARAEMRRFPHAECPAIEPAFRGLVGLRVGRGYTREVQERFGRQLGCTHLELLARLIGPVVIQSIPSSVLRSQPEEGVGPAMAEAGAGWFTDSCHVWASEGPGPGIQKLALGWRPGSSAYPAPPVEALKRSAAGGTAKGAEGAG